MASITSVAEAFFAACETGKGWDGCSAYCTPNATFCAQAEPLLEVKTLAQYTDWMKGIMSVLPDGRYEVKSFATDATRNNVAAYGVFHGTHTGPGGPGSPDRAPHEHRLRLCHAVRGGEDRPHDEDLACRPGDEGARLVIAAIGHERPWRPPLEVVWYDGNPAGSDLGNKADASSRLR